MQSNKKMHVFIIINLNASRKYEIVNEKFQRSIISLIHQLCKCDDCVNKCAKRCNKMERRVFFNNSQFGHAS